MQAFEVSLGLTFEAPLRALSPQRIVEAEVGAVGESKLFAEVVIIEVSHDLLC